MVLSCADVRKGHSTAPHCRSGRAQRLHGEAGSQGRYSAVRSTGANYGTASGRRKCEAATERTESIDRGRPHSRPTRCCLALVSADSNEILLGPRDNSGGRKEDWESVRLPGCRSRHVQDPAGRRGKRRARPIRTCGSLVGYVNVWPALFQHAWIIDDV